MDPEVIVVETEPAPVDEIAVALAEVHTEATTEQTQINADAAVAIAEANTEAAIAIAEEDQKWRALETQVASLSNDLGSQTARMIVIEETLLSIQTQLTQEPQNQNPSELQPAEESEETQVSPVPDTPLPQQEPREPAAPRRKLLRWI